MALVKPDGRPLDVGFAVAGPLDDHLYRDVYRLRIIAGRDTAPNAPDELVLGEPLARIRLRVVIGVEPHREAAECTPDLLPRGRGRHLKH